jgi:hypothetical protein
VMIRVNILPVLMYTINLVYSIIKNQENQV